MSYVQSAGGREARRRIHGATQGISVLWHHPPVGALALLTGGRQQYYANQVRELVVDEARCDFAFLKFPKLRWVRVAYGDRGTHGKICINQYLQPNLEELIFGGAVLAESSIGLMEARCSRLRTIDIDDIPMGIGSDRFLELSRKLQVTEENYG